MFHHQQSGEEGFFGKHLGMVIGWESSGFTVICAIELIRYGRWTRDFLEIKLSWKLGDLDGTLCVMEYRKDRRGNCSSKHSRKCLSFYN